MDPLEIAASYDRIADRWDDPRFDRRNGVAQHERALAFVTQPGTALDVGCGSSGRFIELLQGRGWQVEGVDLSGEMLRFARRRHPQVAFHHADICSWPLPRSYAFITAWDSIWHVPLARQRAVLLKLCAGLAPGGVLIFSAGGTETAGERRDAHMGVPMYHASLGIPGILEAIQAAACTLRHFEYDQMPGPHVYFIVQRS